MRHKETPVIYFTVKDIFSNPVSLIQTHEIRMNREPVQNPSFYPRPFSTPPLHPHPSPAHPYQRQIYSPYPTQQQQQQQQQQPFKFYQE